MTRGNFDLHFTPVEAMDRMAPYHFAIEVEDWDGFLAHLDDLGSGTPGSITRPENNSKFCYIHDPDHTMIELVYHARRTYPAAPEQYTASASRRPARPRRVRPVRCAARRAGHRRERPTTPDLLLRRRQIYYEVHGGPAVLFVHGSGGHHAAWWQQTPTAPDAYSVITLDLRGFGGTAEREEYDSLGLPRRHPRRADAVAAGSPTGPCSSGSRSGRRPR